MKKLIGCTFAFVSTLAFSQSAEKLKTLLLANAEKTFLAAPAFGHVEPTVFEGSLCVGKYFSMGPSIIIEPQFKTVLRMLRKPSCPIYTPSYLPSLTIHRLWKELTYVSLLFGHHSNGQDNGFYTESGEINLRDGNFSTNYVKASVTKRTTRGDLGAGIEQHVNIDRSKELNDKYGFLRAHFSYQSNEKDLSDWLKRIKENNFIQFSFNSAWIFGNIASVKNFNAYKRLVTSVILTYKPSRLNGLSVFFQYFRGQDYYNIHFENILSFSRVGLSIDLHK